ncbi:oligosaccharide flippase family protein [Novosphingobium sp.]|uniref:oligosaccharide flippase family protein n=1 Tax=Novosphingobium sp. TaxID=1874826 RepID=UPI003B51B9EC
MTQPIPLETSVRKALIWNYGVHLVVFVVTFGSTVVVSRLLTPYELGIFGVGIAISGLLSTISYFGVANYLIRDHDLSEQTVTTAFTVNALLCLLVATAVWLLGAIGHSVFADSAIPRVLRLITLIPVFQIFEFLPATLLTRDMRFASTSVMQFGKAAVNAAVTIGFALAGWRYLSPAVGAVMGGLFGALGYSLVGRRHLVFRLSLKGAGQIVTFAVQMIFAGGVSIIAPRIAELIVARALGLSALGLYTRASGLAAMVWDGAYGLSTRVIFIKMSAELRESGSLTPIFLKSTKILTAIMWPAMAGIAVLSGPIITGLYGAQWNGAALPLALIMAGQFVSIGFAMNWELCVLCNRTGWQARVEIFRAATGLIAFAFGAMVNLPFAAASRVVEAIVGFVIYRPRMAEMAIANPAELSMAYRTSLILTIVAITPAVMAMAFSGLGYRAAPCRLMVAVIVGAIFWLMTLHRTRHPLYQELLSVIRRDPAQADA